MSPLATQPRSPSVSLSGGPVPRSGSSGSLTAASRGHPTSPHATSPLRPPSATRPPLRVASRLSVASGSTPHDLPASAEELLRPLTRQPAQPTLPTWASGYMTLLAECSSTPGSMQRHLVRLLARGASATTKAAQFLSDPLDPVRGVLAAKGSEVILRSACKAHAAHASHSGHSPHAPPASSTGHSPHAPHAPSAGHSHHRSEGHSRSHSPASTHSHDQHPRHTAPQPQPQAPLQNSNSNLNLNQVEHPGGAGLPASPAALAQAAAGVPASAFLQWASLAAAASPQSTQSSLAGTPAGGASLAASPSPSPRTRYSRTRSMDDLQSVGEPVNPLHGRILSLMLSMLMSGVTGSAWSALNLEQPDVTALWQQRQQPVAAMEVTHAASPAAAATGAALLGGAADAAMQRAPSLVSAPSLPLASSLRPTTSLSLSTAGSLLRAPSALAGAVAGDTGVEGALGAGGMALSTAMRILRADSKHVVIPDLGNVLDSVLDAVNESMDSMDEGDHKPPSSSGAGRSSVERERAGKPAPAEVEGGRVR